MRHRLSILGGLLAVAMSFPAAGVVYQVNSSGDAADDDTGDGICQTATAGECTLRAAIQEANRASGAATINFNIGGGGMQTIAPASALPALTNTSGITIDGFSQPGSSPNTDPIADNAVYGIELVGNGPNAFDGFFVGTPNNVFRGLDMHAFRRAIWFNSDTADNNVVEGNMFGLTPSGNFDPTYTYVAASSCIVLQIGADHNIIGAPGAANSSHDLLRKPSVSMPADSICLSASGRGAPEGRLPALYAVKAPFPRWFRIASAMIERAEFPVQRNRTL